jgi:multidrug efflux pump subunit AcrB
MYQHFIKNHSFTIIILFISASLGSVLLIDSLNLQLNPRLRAQKIFVNVNYQNASPEVVELKVTTPLEAAFSRLQGVSNIKSRSAHHSAEVELDLEPGIDVEYLRFEIANKVREVYPSLPEEASYPTIRTQGLDDSRKNSPILSYSVYADDAIDNVSNYIREYLVPVMSTVEGVESLKTSGESKPEYVIYLDKEKMDALNITETTIRSALSRMNREEGLSYARFREEIIYVILNHKTVDDLHQLIIQQNDQRTILLREVAQIKLEPQEPERIYRINGKNNVRLNFYPEEDANHLTVAVRIKSKIQSQRSLLPAGI